MAINRGIGGHQRPNYGRSDEWYTPPFIFDALGLTFDLDPCSPVDGPVPWVPAKRFLSIEQNGLLALWAGCVWMNPPYGRGVVRWMARMAEHGNGVALVFARTDTQWFHDYGISADVACFLRGRLDFIGGKREADGHNAGGPHVLLGYGSECAAAVERCGLGAVARFEQRLSSEHSGLRLTEAIC